MAVPGSFSCSLGAITPTSIYVSWTASSGATHYVVGGGASSSGNITSTNFTLTYTPARYAPDGQVVSVTAYNADGNRSATGSPMVAYFPVAPVSVPTPSNFRVTSFSGNSISVAWNAISGTSPLYQLTITGSGNTFQTNSTSYTFSGLSGSTTYTISLRAILGSEASDWTSLNQTTSASVPVPGQPGVISQTFTATTANLSWGSATNAHGYYVELANQSGGSSPPMQTVYSTSASFSGLFSQTNYVAIVTAFNSLGEVGSSRVGTTFTTPSSALAWVWTTPEIQAFDGNGNFNTLTAARWNEFLNRINDFCTLKGVSQLYLPTLTRVSGQPLTANIFNTVCSKIDQLPNSTLSAEYMNRVSGNTVFGVYFKTMATQLNNNA